MRDRTVDPSGQTSHHLPAADADVGRASDVVVTFGDREGHFPYEVENALHHVFKAHYGYDYAEVRPNLLNDACNAVARALRLKRADARLHPAVERPAGER